MANLKSQRYCDHWVRTGKCMYGPDCRYFHPKPKEGIILGTCLDLARGITHCKGPEYCSFEHKVHERYSNNPCTYYMYGFCSLGVMCQGEHNIPSAAAVFSDSGKSPPKFLKDNIHRADLLWSRNIGINPIGGLKLISLLQMSIRDLFISDECFSRFLAETIAEYAVEYSAELDKKEWSVKSNCQIYISASSTKEEKSFIECKYPMRVKDLEIGRLMTCNLCNQWAFARFAWTSCPGKFTIICRHCISYMAGPMENNWSWNNGIPVPYNAYKATSLSGFPCNDRFSFSEVITVDNLLQLTENQEIRIVSIGDDEITVRYSK